MAGHTGKRGRAVGVSIDTTAQVSSEQEVEVIEPAFSTVSNVKPTNFESDIVDLYTADANLGKKGELGQAKPFIHQVQLHGPQGKIVRVWALFDEGAMREAMSTRKFHESKHRLGTLLPSSLALRMADGSIVKSSGRWEGEISVKNITGKGAFEVFDSKGNWDFLFGKTLLKAFKAIHDYNTDEVKIEGVGGLTILKNQVYTMEARKHPKLRATTPPICVVTEEEQHLDGDNPAAEIKVKALQENNNLFTRKTKPHKPERVAEILRLITIGNDLSEDKRLKVQELIRSFADFFALSP
jgi:hypothetical protein